MAANQEEIKKHILKTTQNVDQRQSEAYNNLKRQGQSLKASNKNINELRDERRKGDEDLAHIKRHKNIFLRFFLDYCCCQWCRDLIEGKPPKPPPIVTTESEEPDPDPVTVEDLWKQDYKPPNWLDQMNKLLAKLEEESDEYEAEIAKQKELVEKMNKKAKIETKQLGKSSNNMKDITKK